MNTKAETMMSTKPDGSPVGVETVVRTLIAEMRRDYTEPAVPPCPVCRHSRNKISEMGMGRITYRCGSDDANPMGKEDKEIRGKAWQHFEASRFETRTVDHRVLQLCDELEARL